MYRRNRYECYVCLRHGQNGQNYVHIYGNARPRVRDIAIARRDGNRHPPEDVGPETRICNACFHNIRDEIQRQDRQEGITMNVLVVPNDSCCICHNRNDIHNLTIECKVEVYLKCNIFIPENVAACNEHLDGRGYILRPLLPALQCVNRRIVVRPQYMQRFMSALPLVSQQKWQFNDIYDLADEEVLKFTAMTRENFEELFTFCLPVPRRGGHYTITRKHLLTFLCKMKQGLSDDFLATMFKYPSRQSANLAITNVRQSLMMRFVPENVGLTAITRQQYIDQHVTDFANALYNPNPNNRVAISFIDGTYTFCFKSSNFRVLRQSYCTHKSRHLIKPALIVAPNGYILDIHGPYFSDAQNNDASMIVNEFVMDDEINNWFQEGDIVIVDRGYRDAVPLLEDFGFICRMPPLLEAGQNQLSTEDANESRIITKLRWVVEARNGHIKTIFKLLNMVQQIHVLPHIGDYYRIAAAIINRYHPKIIMEGADANLAHRMQARAALANNVQARVEAEDLTRRDVHNWIQLDEAGLNDFPILTIEYLENLTVGCYQIGLAPSYVQDKLQRENDEAFQVEIRWPENRLPEPGFLRTRIWSRFRNNARYQQFISYVADGNVDNEPIRGYYCTCKCGTRTLGTCAHITSVLWYLGFARHHDNVHYPSHRLINEIEDAGQRPPPEGPP